MSSKSEDNFISSFPICMLFVSFSCLIVPSKTNTVLNKNGKKGHPCLFPSFKRKNIQFFLIKYDVSCRGFGRCSLSNWICSHIFQVCWEFLIMSGVKVYQMCFLHLLIWLLFFNLLMWWITLIEFWVLNQSCITGIISVWLLCLFLFMHCLIWHANILIILKILHLYSWHVFVFGFPFLKYLYLIFGSGAMLASEWVRMSPLLLFFLEEIVKNWYNLFFKCLVGFTSKTIWAWRLWVFLKFESFIE